MSTKTTTTPATNAASLIGNTIREARERLGLTKTEAALSAHISRKTWHELEAGVRDAPHRPTLQRVEQALDMEPGTLYAMSGTAANAEVEALRQRAVRLVRIMSSDELVEVIDRFGPDATAREIAELRAEVARLRAAAGDGRSAHAG
jgi:transcriptional regulator with XRE-family HTH domain